MEIFKNYSDFEKRILFLYPDSQVGNFSNSPINKKIFQSLETDNMLRIVTILTYVCKEKLNSDFILASIYESIYRKCFYYLIVENYKIVAFCILAKENKKEFEEYVDVQQLKQYLSEQQLELPNLLRVIQDSNFICYSISILCSCKRGKGKQLVDQIPSTINNQSFILTIDSPLKELKRYYQSLGFIYEKNLVDWSGTIYKIIEK